MSQQEVPRSGAILWLVLWTVVPLFFDAYFLFGTGWQLAALRYPTVPGVVTSSHVETDMDDDGFSYTPEIRYRYTVNGVAFAGDCYRYFMMGSNDNTASRIVADFPAGRPVEVHYNPDDPSDAVLQAGLAGRDLFMALFLLPFNIVMVGSWSLVIMVWRRLQNKGPFAAFKVRRRGSRLFVNLEEGRLAFAVITALMLSIVLVVAVGLCFGVDPPLPVMVGAWGVVLVASGVVHVLNGPAGQGLRLLVLDDGARKL